MEPLNNGHIRIRSSGKAILISEINLHGDKLNDIFLVTEGAGVEGSFIRGSTV